MGTRAQLKTRLEGLSGVVKVYGQTPSNLKMQYPCIIHKLDDIDTEFADNDPYRHTKRYQLTLIDDDPDSPIVDEIMAFRMCKFDRFYAANDKNHFVFQLFF